MQKFKVTLKLKKPWSHITEWARKPDLDAVLEVFADLILEGEVDDLFEVTIEEVLKEAKPKRK